ncbi:MAG: hypothetical protein NTY61_03730 [Candidatus Parcubacteria bacterium]|nr:hypothetical protein [Candidatus Parcubacteria bacterium]
MNKEREDRMHKPISVALQPTRVILSDKRIRSEVAGKTIWEFVKSHVRCLFTEALNLFFNHSWIYWLIGLSNRKFRLIESVFLVYPATDDYTSAYSYAYRSRWHEWKPGPIGFFWQNGKLGVKFAISAHNGQFSDPANKDKLRQVVEKMERIRKLFHAKHKTFAGILPGVLFMKRLVRETPEADVTVEAVRQVIERVRLLEGLSDDTPVIVLGGRGFIGRRVVDALPKGTTYSVDIAGCNGQNVWPDHLRGKPTLLVNISLNSALGQYIHLLWPEIVIVNEVYPEPSQELAQQLKAVGCHCYHVVGVKAKALPSFPGGYQGGIPCCAAWRAESMEALFKRIV